MSTRHEHERGEWSASWQVPVVAAIAIGVSMIPMYSLGPLMPAIHASTGWTRSQISSGLTFTSLAAVLLSPFVGTLVDRLGSRRIALPGLVCFCAAVAMLSMAGPRITSWWMIWSVVAITDAFIRVTVWTTAVVTRFSRSRGLAIGIALSGTGLGSTFLPYTTTRLQEAYGWRHAFLLLALGGLLLSFPLVWFLFYGANDKGANDRHAKHKRPNGEEYRPAPALSPRVTALSVPKSDALRSRRYIQMLLACLLAGIASGGLAVHFVPILRSGGLPARTAAAVAGAVGISVIAGRLSGGYLLDRVSAPMVGFLSCILPVVGCPTLLLSHTTGAGVFAGVMLGLSTGSEIAVLSYLIPRYFGVRHFGLLFGMISGLQTLGTGVGPWLAGAMFDHFGNYNRVLLLAMPLYLAGAILLGTLGRPADEQPSESPLLVPEPAL